ncbi:Inositol 2-dehydrogenase/D-chiro-inositol 3-dehydrogenase [Dyadobacter sp. CECT 9275]|uniref:Inositol 2-dehydrogenase/D-chiro-inositol 3-dehydrogenase n=1 Tax=Dyadobacter helix TaxID=2822344 RepID=A0A916NB04_9BACT|nr:Gfo/Idh/MocA family oxidoreductase [Dyadobacter sp. CECT 9275]CAG4993968.1 Inositol 2-dehydrogenase/D-chiro-inositol 3-dehydrogenase [Dyadobacter sp. CECT 9275]
MSNFNEKNRRDFIKKLTGGALLAASPVNPLLAGRPGSAQEIPWAGKKITANDTIQIACIGTGIMGMGDTRTALKIPGVKLMAVADLYDGRLVRAKELFGNDIQTTRDYSQILSRKDIDAIILATPDHLHSQIGIEALKAGKAVYCEKPMVHKIEQGHDMIKAAKASKKTFQVGSQRVSSIIYAKVKELYKAGAIGELNFIEVYYDRHSAQGAWQYSLPPDASPATVDWNRFLSDKAPKIAYDPLRFFRWRNYQDYGTGVAGDLFVHLFSGLHYILDSKGPNRVMTSGGLRYWKDGRDVPDVMVGIYDYPKTASHPAFNLTLRVNFVDGSGGGSGFRFVGTDGQITLLGDTVTVKRKKMPIAPGYSISTFPKALQDQFLASYNEKYPVKPEMSEPDTEEYKAPEGYDDRLDHFANFFDSMRNNTKVVEDAEFGFRAAGPALLSNKSYFEKTIVNWDPEAMKIV